MGARLTAKKVQKAKSRYATNGRNVQEAARFAHCSVRALHTYKNNAKGTPDDWDDYADTQDRLTAEKAQITVAERRAKQLEVCDLQLEQIKETTGPGPIPFKPSPSELKNLVQTTELLTGGDTDRISLGTIEAQFDKLDDESKLKLIADLRQRAGGCAGSPNDGGPGEVRSADES